MRAEPPSSGRSLLLTIVFIAPIALMIGVMIGGWQVRGEVRALKEELAEAERRENHVLGTELVRAMRDRATTAPPPPQADDPSKPADLATKPAEPAEGERDDPPAPPTRPANGPDSAQLQGARELMRIRQGQALKALTEQANPDAAQLRAIDDLVSDMNEQLESVAYDISALLEEGEEPSRRDTMVLAVDFMEILIEADDRMYQTLDEGQREGLDPRLLDPLSYIDERVIDALSGI